MTIEADYYKAVEREMAPFKVAPGWKLIYRQFKRRFFCFVAHHDPIIHLVGSRPTLIECACCGKLQYIRQPARGGLR